MTDVHPSERFRAAHVERHRTLHAMKEWRAAVNEAGEKRANNEYPEWSAFERAAAEWDAAWSEWSASVLTPAGLDPNERFLF